jgi:cold shock CspA family protein/ribosome-associated translation inhibitor RaiA
MQIKPEITYKGIDGTQAVKDLILKQINKLEKVCDYMISLHVAIEKSQSRHQLGNPYRIRIDMRIPPNHELVVKRNSVIHHDTRDTYDKDEEGVKSAPQSTRKDEPLPTAIRRTFDSARRQLEKLVEQERGETKSHPQNQIMAFVDRLYPQENYGFLRSLDGEQIYFHRNSTLHEEWDRIKVGTGVRYVVEEGEKGLQATTVEIVNKPGAYEIHNELHELPVVATINKRNI